MENANARARFAGHEVETPVETMEQRILAFRKQCPDWTIHLKVEHPYKDAFPALKTAPGLGEIAVHRAILKDGAGAVKAEASVIQANFSLFDYGKKAVCDAIWYAGQAFGPKMTMDEIRWEDEIVHPVEKMRRKLNKRKIEISAESKRRQLKSEKVRALFPSEPEPEPWYFRLHPEDREWVVNQGGDRVDQGRFLNPESIHPDVPEELARIGVGAKELDGEIMLFESKYAPEGCLSRNYVLLKETGFDPSRLTKKTKKIEKEEVQ